MVVVLLVGAVPPRAYPARFARAPFVPRKGRSACCGVLVGRHPAAPGIPRSLRSRPFRATKGAVVADEGVALMGRLGGLVGRPLAAPGPHPSPLPSNGRGGMFWRMRGLLR